MDIDFTCPFCDQPLTVDQQGAGTATSCPSCDRTITIPQHIEASPPKTPAVSSVSQPVRLAFRGLCPPKTPAVSSSTEPIQVIVKDANPIQVIVKDTNPIQVIVKDIEMSFGSMVIFMIKWVLASIPAFLILCAIFAFVFAFVGGLLDQ